MSEIDDDCECQRCHETYLLRDGETPTKYCDHCAHERVEELQSALNQREVQLRKAMEERDEAQARCREMLALIESALAHLCDAGQAKEYDPSWSHPKRLPIKEVQERCIQAYHELHKALE